MKPLRIQLEEVKVAAQPWEADLTREELDEVLRQDPPTEFQANGASHVRAALTRVGRKLLVKAHLAVPLKGICRRCLKPVTPVEKVDFTLTYFPLEEATKVPSARKPREGQAPSREEDSTEASFDLDSVDQEPYSGTEIELSAALREQVLLSIPSSPLCREDCKGLCSRCGKDLNEGECGCDRTVVDPRWQALKGIQLDKKEK